MKIDTLVFVQWLVAGPCGVALRPHAVHLLPAILACVKDPFYKITAEALRVMQALVKVIRPLSEFFLLFFIFNSVGYESIAMFILLDLQINKSSYHRSLWHLLILCILVLW